MGRAWRPVAAPAGSREPKGYVQPRQSAVSGQELHEAFNCAVGEFMDWRPREPEPAIPLRLRAEPINGVCMLAKQFGSYDMPDSTYDMLCNLARREHHDKLPDRTYTSGSETLERLISERHAEERKRKEKVLRGGGVPIACGAASSVGAAPMSAVARARTFRASRRWAAVIVNDCRHSITRDQSVFLRKCLSHKLFSGMLPLAMLPLMLRIVAYPRGLFHAV